MHVPMLSAAEPAAHFPLAMDSTNAPAPVLLSRQQDLANFKMLEDVFTPFVYDVMNGYVTNGVVTIMECAPHSFQRKGLV
jgi:hypothetical protein